jgi:hypothetical protein
MRHAVVRWFGSFSFALIAACGGLAACGGTTAAVKPAPPPVTKVEVVQDAPREPSPYEQKWSAACNEGGIVGQCPAPFEKAAVFVDVAEGEHAVPPFCGAIEAPDGAAVRDALMAKRKALKACFKGTAPGTFVELGPDATVVTDPSRAKAAKAEACVAKHAKRILSGIKDPQPERIVVLQSAPAKPGEQALSKENLDKVIQAHADEVNACYDGALAVWPGLKGRIASSLVIWFDGNVALVRTGESTLDNPMLECCINTAIRSWTFPRPSDGTIALVTFPFTLGSRD